MFRRFLNICILVSFLSFEGSRMIQVMLLKSLLQVSSAPPGLTLSLWSRDQCRNRFPSWTSVPWSLGWRSNKGALVVKEPEERVECGCHDAGLHGYDACGRAVATTLLLLLFQLLHILSISTEN